jgi:hypothetical protein
MRCPDPHADASWLTPFPPWFDAELLATENIYWRCQERGIVENGGDVGVWSEGHGC